MSNERRKVPLDEAVRRIGDGERVHTFRNPGLMLIGCDWERDKLIEAITRFGVEEAGPIATRMGHTLVLFDHDGPLFIEAAPGDEDEVER